MTTPAERIAMRAPTDLLGKARGSVDLVSSPSTPSPSILTKPPSGMAASTYSVSPRRNPNRVGPKPIENFSTFTPFHLASRKWPSSWMKMTKPRPTATLAMFRTEFRVSNVLPPDGPRRRPPRGRRGRAEGRMSGGRAPHGRRGGCRGSGSSRRGSGRPPPRWRRSGRPRPSPRDASPRSRARGRGRSRGRGARNASRTPATGRASGRAPRRGRGTSAQYWIGSLMSGGDIWATTLPSTNSTIEWTTLSGWTTTSIWSGRRSKSHRASMTSRALFIRVAESIEIFGPIFQVGCRSASSGVTSASSRALRPRNGPPDEVRITRRTSRFVPARAPGRSPNARCRPAAGCRRAASPVP